GRSDLQAVQVAIGPAGIDVVIDRGVLDAEPFLGGDKDATASSEPEALPPQERRVEPLSVRAPRLEVLYFAEDRRLEQVNLELRRGLRGWETIRLSGSIPEQYWSPRETPEVDAAAPAALDRRYVQLSFAADAGGSGQHLLAQS